MSPDRPTPRPTAVARHWPAVLLAVALGFHAFQSFRLFPSWGALTDGERPVVVADHAIHLYHGALGSRFLRDHGTTWGYDPFFMAGYPETPVWDSSSNLAVAFQFLAGGGYSPRAYKLGLLACTLLTVGLLPIGARLAGLGGGEAAAAAALGALVFWSGVPLSFWRTGLFAFVTASSAVGAVAALLLRFDRRPTPGRWAALAAAGSAVLFAHVTAPFLFAGPAAGYLAATAWRWRVRRSRLAAVLAAVAVAVAVNAFWVLPLLRFRDIRTGSGFYMTPPTAGYLWRFYLAQPLDGRLGLALLVLGLAGLAAWWREGQRLRVALFGGGVAALVALCSVGGLWSVTKTTEPFRFLAALDLLLTVPAGSWLVRAAGWLARAGGHGWRGASLAAAAGGTALGAAWLASPLTFILIAHYALEHRPLVVGLRTEDRALVRWLRENTDLSARVLFEDQLRLLEPTDPESTHWTPLLPVLLRPEGRAFIGGLYQTAFILHHRAAAFGDYQLGDRRIDHWRPGDLDAYITRYNVGWVVCWSPLSRFCLDVYPGARLVATLPRPVSPGLEVMRDRKQWDAIAARAGAALANHYLGQGVNHSWVYRVDRPHSYFLEGRGRLVALDANRVELADVEPDPATGAAVLSLHWLDTFRADPPVPLAPVYVAGDPVPFVRVSPPGPVPRLVLTNGY